MSANQPEIDTPKKAGTARIKKPRKGWHPVDIKAALEKRGMRMAWLSRQAGYSRNSVSDTINGKWWPAIERVIADALEVAPWELWPERYNDYGQPVQQGNPNMVKLPRAGRPRNAELKVVK